MNGIAIPAPVAPGVTQNGALLGTAPYMSPEQARGRTADKRSDIWAFGCVLYEMLAGAPAFAGEGTADLLANVVTAEPDWGAFPSDVPPALRMCVQRCLQKDLRQRFHDIADVRLAMQGAFEPAASGATRHRPSSSDMRSGLGRCCVGLVVALAIVAFPAADPLVPPETRLEIVTPPAADPLSLAISPDGRSVVFQAGRDLPQLWLRRLIRPMPGRSAAPRVSDFHSGHRQPLGRLRGGPGREASRSRQRPDPDGCQCVFRRCGVGPGRDHSARQRDRPAAPRASRGRGAHDRH